MKRKRAWGLILLGFLFVASLLCSCTGNIITSPPPLPPVTTPTPTWYYVLDTSFAGGAVSVSAYGYGIRSTSSGKLWIGTFPAASPNYLTEWTTIGGLSQTVSQATIGGTTYPIYSTFNVGVGPDNYVYVTDLVTLGIELDTAGTGVTTFTTGSGTSLWGVAVSPSRAYLLDTSANTKVSLFNVSGTGAAKTFTYAGSFGTTGPGTLGSNPGNINLNSAGTTVYVADTANSRVVEYDAAGTYQAAITLTPDQPMDMATDGAGNIFVVATGTMNTIYVYSPAGVLLTTFGNPILGDPNYIYPTGITLDSAGNVYVIDYGFLLKFLRM